MWLEDVWTAFCETHDPASRVRASDITAWLDERGVFDRSERREITVMVRTLDNRAHERVATPDG